MNRRLLPVPFLAAAALAVGCGGESGSPDADPAAIVPASAPIYVEATLKPDGESTDALKSLSQKLAGVADPGAELKKLLDEDGPGGFKWDEDIAPWVGDRVGFFVTSFDLTGEDIQGALIAPTSDADKAKESLEKDLAEKDEGDPAPKVESRDYKDTSYKVDTVGDTAVAIVGDYALTGSESGIKAAIDASKAEGLADAEAFTKSRDAVEDDALAFGYLRFEQLLAAAGPEVAALKPMLGQLGEAMSISVDAETNAIEAEIAQVGVKGAGAGTGDPGKILTTLPGDSWLSAGVADIGGQLDTTLKQVGTLGAFGGFDLEEVLGQVEQAFDIDVEKDLIAWMGDGGVFVRGSDLSAIGGGLVVQSKDPAATKAVIPKLAKFIRQAASGQGRVTELDAPGVDAGFTVKANELPLPIHVAAAGDKFIVAVTDAALEAALKPSATLGDSAAYKDAAAKLGDDLKPSLLLDVAPVKSLLDGLGLASDPEVKPFTDALGKLTTVTAGGTREGDINKAKIVVGVK